MKNQIKGFVALLFIGLLFVACTERKKINTISGVVQEIQMGKDGYTAKIETPANQIYFATISHTNLADHSQYRTVQVGDIIEVAGDEMEMAGEKRITVRQLYPEK